MTDLPPGWVQTTLGEILLRIEAGKSFSCEPRRANADEWGIIKVSAMTWGSFREEDNKAVPPGVAFDPSYEIKPGDILVSRANTQEYVGAPVLVGSCRPRLLLSDKSLRLVPSPHIDRRWLAFLLSSPLVRGEISRRATGTKDSMRNISQSSLGDIKIWVPSLSEQQRIVASLEAYFTRLGAGENDFARAYVRAKALWQSVLNGVMDGEIAGHDAGASVRVIGDVASVQGGIQKQQKRRPVKNKFPFLRVANVSRGGLDLKDVHEVELFDGEVERFKLAFGDLLVVEGNGSPDQVGRAAMWHDEIPDCVHQNHLIRVRPHPELDPGYLELVWNAPATKSQLRKVASSTSGLHTLSTTKVKAIQIPVPPLDVQRGLLAEAQRWRSHLDVVEREMGNARQRSNALRRSLLKEAFAGRLLPQDPADEPASELLARIRAEKAQHPKTTRVRRTKPKTSPAETRTEWPDAGHTPTTYEQGELL